MGSLSRQLRRRPAWLAFKQYLVREGMKTEATIPLPPLDIATRRLQRGNRKPYREKGETVK